MYKIDRLPFNVGPASPVGSKERISKLLRTDRVDLTLDKRKEQIKEEKKKRRWRRRGYT